MAGETIFLVGGDVTNLAEAVAGSGRAYFAPSCFFLAIASLTLSIIALVRGLLEEGFLIGEGALPAGAGFFKRLRMASQGFTGAFCEGSFDF